VNKKTIYTESYDRELKSNSDVEHIKEKREATKREQELLYRLQQERQNNELLTRRLREAESELQRLRAKLHAQR
jgi:hypothetical protein